MSFNPNLWYIMGNNDIIINTLSYSTHKLNSNNIYPAEVERSLDSTKTDIGYSGSVIDTSAITTFASGTASYYSKLYEQNGTGLNLDTAVGYPLATDAGFNGLNYLDDTTQEQGLYLINSSTNLYMAGDWVVQYCFRNETQANNGRSNLIIRNAQVGMEGNFVLGMRPSGTNYLIGCRYSLPKLQKSQAYYTIPKGDTVTTFTLFTFSYIGGVFSFYRNNVLQSEGGTNEIIGGANNYPNLIALGTGYSTDLSQGKINNTKGFEIKTGVDLSSFNVSGYNTDTMTRFGI